MSTRLICLQCPGRHTKDLWQCLAPSLSPEPWLRLVPWPDFEYWRIHWTLFALSIQATSVSSIWWGHYRAIIPRSHLDHAAASSAYPFTTWGLFWRQQGRQTLRIDSIEPSSSSEPLWYSPGSGLAVYHYLQSPSLPLPRGISSPRFSCQLSCFFGIFHSDFRTFPSAR